MIKNPPCKSCHGAGRVEKDRSLAVNIPPAGVETGTRIRLAGEGEAGMRGGPAGDLYIFIEVQDHALFDRESIHLHCRVPVSMTTAALGGARSRCRRSTVGVAASRSRPGLRTVARCACAERACQPAWRRFW